MKNNEWMTSSIKDEIEQMKLKDPSIIKNKNKNIKFWQKLRLIIDSMIKKVS